MRATFRLAAAVPASFPCLYVSVRSSYKHRFKVTATGKILFPSPGYVHKRFNKSHRQLGDLSKKQVMKPRYAKTVSVCSLRLAALHVVHNSITCPLASCFAQVKKLGFALRHF